MNDDASAPTTIHLLLAQPIKVLLFIHAGVLAWYLLLRICLACTPMNVTHLLRLSYLPHDYVLADGPIPATGEFPTTQTPSWVDSAMLTKGVWRMWRQLLAVVAITVAMTVPVFWWFPENVILMPIAQLLPLIALVYMVYRLFGSSDYSGIGQIRVSTTFSRIALGRIDWIHLRTNDILVLDLLVLYARVINDAVMFMYMWYWDHSHYPPALELACLSAPLVLRISQCWREYRGQGFKRRAPMFNMIKYMTGILPHVCAYLMVTRSEQKLEFARLRAYCLALNSVYSYLWDVTMDWLLSITSFLKTGRWRSAPFPTNFRWSTYAVAIIADGLLRFVWLLKSTFPGSLSSMLFDQGPYSVGYATLEGLEIFRRWIWCIFKLESDWSLIVPGDIEMESKGIDYSK